MRECVELGPVPSDEDCAQVGTNDYLEKGKAECRRFKTGLEKRYPSVKFGIKSNPHDFGVYYDVVAYYNDDDEDETNAAFNVEANCPRSWGELERD